MDLHPVHLIFAVLGIMMAAPVVGAVLAFTPNTKVRKSGRCILAAGCLACTAAVIVSIWHSGRQSAGIGNHVFLLIAIAPALLGFVWFVIWMAARRLEHLRSLPPDLRRVEELADIEEGIEDVSRDLRQKEKRANSLLVSSKERARLRAEIPLLRMTLDRLKAERGKRSP